MSRVGLATPEVAAWAEATEAAALVAAVLSAWRIARAFDRWERTLRLEGMCRAQQSGWPDHHALTKCDSVTELHWKI